MTLKVFISYAREDRERALMYYERLAREGVDPWLDFKKLLPGQSWEPEISRALLEANVVVLLLSPRSVNKRGFVQREANDAIDRLRYKQPTDIYVIPLLLEPCEVPLQIATRLQYVDLTTEGSWDQVRAALKVASEQQSIQIERGLAIGPFVVFDEQASESVMGELGIEVTYPRFNSPTHPRSASELSALFYGRAIQKLTQWRGRPWGRRSYEGDIAGPGGTQWEGYGVIHAADALVSISYEVNYFHTGAAHGGSAFETLNFALINDRVIPLELEDFFLDVEAALARISELSVKSLSREFWNRIGTAPDDRDVAHFRSGAGPQPGNFASFTVAPSGLTFLFPPYQVAAYALGRWAVDIPFFDLLDLLRPDGHHTLAIPALP